MTNYLKAKVYFFGLALLLFLVVVVLFYRTESRETWYPESLPVMPPTKLMVGYETAEQTLPHGQDLVNTSRHLVPSEKVLPYRSQYGPLPSSLEGTLMRQSLSVDPNGNLRISADIRRVFEFFLAAVEEEDLSVILKRIQEYLDFNLDEPALGQALRVMTQYVDFKKALFDYETERSKALEVYLDSSVTLSTNAYVQLLDEQLQMKKYLRGLYLDPQVHKAFYADEEVYDDYSLARISVQADKSLSLAEKRQRLEEIDSQAPEELVASRREAQIIDILKAETQRLKEQGAESEEIQQLRTQLLGAEAAERFDKLDQERAIWQHRIDDYLQHRESILSLQGLGEPEKLQQVEELRQRLFDNKERIRVSVYERKAETVR